MIYSESSHLISNFNTNIEIINWNVLINCARLLSTHKTQTVSGQCSGGGGKDVHFNISGLYYVMGHNKHTAIVMLKQICHTK